MFTILPFLKATGWNKWSWNDKNDKLFICSGEIKIQCSKSVHDFIDFQNTRMGDISMFLEHFEDHQTISNTWKQLVKEPRTYIRIFPKFYQRDWLIYSEMLFLFYSSCLSFNLSFWAPFDTIPKAHHVDSNENKTYSWPIVVFAPYYSAVTWTQSVIFHLFFILNFRLAHLWVTKREREKCPVP